MVVVCAAKTSERLETQTGEKLTPSILSKWLVKYDAVLEQEGIRVKFAVTAVTEEKSPILFGFWSENIPRHFAPENGDFRAKSEENKENSQFHRTSHLLPAVSENESIKYEIYFKLIIATGMRRGEYCALQYEKPLQKTIDIPGQLCYHKPRVRDGLLSSMEVNVHG